MPNPRHSIIAATLFFASTSPVDASGDALLRSTVQNVNDDDLFEDNEAPSREDNEAPSRTEEKKTTKAQVDSQPSNRLQRKGIEPGDILLSGSLETLEAHGTDATRLSFSYERILSSGNQSVGLGLGMNSHGESYSTLYPAYRYWFQNVKGELSPYVEAGVSLSSTTTFLSAGGGFVAWITDTAGVRPSLVLLIPTEGGSSTVAGRVSISVRR